MKRLTMTLVAVASVVLVSGCGAATPENSAEPGAAGLTPVTVGAIPIGDVAPLHLGLAEGFFEDEGIDLSIETISGGAVAVPGVVSGSFDFAFGNTVSLMVAQDKGLDLKYVTNGTTSTGSSDADFAGVVVMDDSAIETATDLEGKTVSSNNLSNIGDTSIRTAVDNAGGDGASLTFVEVAFPNALAALETGQIDAALILEPFLTPALQNGARVVSWNYAETHENLDIGGYFTTGDVIKDSPELVASFAAAMNRSLEYAQEHPAEVRTAIGTYTEIPADVLDQITLPRFTTEFDRDAAAVLGAAAVKYGTISQAPDLDALLPS
ncbi:nitrate ABC transporter substrate-binding protein [Cryobacterium melibiosiphilum]|uniref:Nitrate ABC transporter substrate-binding protein n=3 Tax=Cryobacterium melibiosiphilum TaxID=995039 RepID=A0A3A5MEM5_9MICO|nr:nitrate ABC transporter substrate-binding protein [Cryobacterium melibiosiphilum]